jgi:hypothetical protein
MRIPIKTPMNPTTKVIELKILKISFIPSPPATVVSTIYIKGGTYYERKNR